MLISVINIQNFNLQTESKINLSSTTVKVRNLTYNLRKIPHIIIALKHEEANAPVNFIIEYYPPIFQPSRGSFQT